MVTICTVLSTVLSNTGKLFADIKMSCFPGKGKGEPQGRQLFAAYSTGTLIIAVVDIQNTNKGTEIAALDAFGDGVMKCIENQI